MKTDQNSLEELYPEMPSTPSDIEISQNAKMKPYSGNCFYAGNRGKI